MGVSVGNGEPCSVIGRGGKYCYRAPAVVIIRLRLARPNFISNSLCVTFAFHLTKNKINVNHVFGCLRFPNNVSNARVYPAGWVSPEYVPVPRAAPHATQGT